MRIIEARNVHEALPMAIKLLLDNGVRRDTRNGPVLQSPWPITTVYHRPVERVLFWPERDANPFFHLFESLWMLTGQNELAPLLKYVKRMETFSDDGQTLHGAYGYRWRRHFLGAASRAEAADQLLIVAKTLRDNPEDRRCVLQMWDPIVDLGRSGRDLPCNLTCTFQRGKDGELNLVVFNRSNDIIWGCYGANAVHFSFLLEYMAVLIGCSVGTYTQVSVNWHAYIATLRPLEHLRSEGRIFKTRDDNPYSSDYGKVLATPMDTNAEDVVDTVNDLYAEATDTGFINRSLPRWAEVFQAMFEAHRLYRETTGINRYDHAMESLQPLSSRDWCQAGVEWLARRRSQYLASNKE